MSIEHEEFDEEAKALAEAIDSTPEEAFLNENNVVTPVKKKGSSIVMKLLVGVGAVFVLAMGGAYYYTNNMVEPSPVRKPTMPKLADDVVGQSQNAVVAQPSVTQPPVELPVPTQMPAAVDPFSNSAGQAPAPAIATSPAVEVKTVANTSTPEKEEAKTVEVATPKVVSKVRKSHNSKSSIKKADTGYVQLF